MTVRNSAAVARACLRDLFQKASGGTFAVEYWDEGTEHYGSGTPQFRLVVKDPHLSDLISSDMMSAFSEAFMDGRIEVRGDVADLVSLAIRNDWLSERSVAQVLNCPAQAGEQVQCVIDRQQNHAPRKYGLDTDFFRLWLDKAMVYSCAYFVSADETLDEAQHHKIEYSLRKLRLGHGETLLDIGCGWGALVTRASEDYDINVLGVTLDDGQCRTAQQTIAERGLGDRARVRVMHYDTLASELARFDKIVCIGMIEHVGKPHIAHFVYTVGKLLKPGGLALLHTITRPTEGPVIGWSDKFMYPGAFVPTLAEMTGHLLRNNLRVWDIESLTPHYRHTLDHWSERFECHIPEVERRYGWRFVQMWRLYLRCTSACFREGSLELHQILVSNGMPATLPLTRSDLYTQTKSGWRPNESVAS